MKHFFIKAIKYIYRETFLHYIAYFSAYFPFFPTLMVTKIRRKLWKIMGVRIGKNVFIGYGIYLDVSSLKRLKIGDNAIIAAETLILLHKRDISKYYRGVIQHDLPMKECFINIEDNASIGMRSIILPGVTVGEGAVIGANSMVTKDIPSYSVAVGSPAKIISKIPLEK